MSQRIVHTHCQICEQLCGINVTVEEDRIIAIEPDKQNPYTWRDFCIKASHAGDVVTSPWRLLQPMRRQGDRYVPATYEEAVDDIATRLRAIVDRFGPNAVGGYSGNPQGFNFGSVAYHNAFLSALGTHQVYGVSSIDSNAKHVATDRMFGVETLALIPDIDATDCALLIGTNPAISKFNWGGKVPDGWKRLRARVNAGAELIVVDPRRTETAAHATLYLAPLPEEDWALLLGMIQVIFADGTERLPAEGLVAGLDDLRQLANAMPLARLAAICDVPEADIAEAARRFARAKSAFAFAATGPALGRNGVLTHWLTLALNLITDRVDRAGGRCMPNWPFNAAINAARMPKKPRIRSRVRGLEPVVGQHALAELADEITTPGEGQIRALIMGGGNPVANAAGGEKLASALKELELLVSVDLFQRESHVDADWLIPGQHFLERDEAHVYLHALNDRPFVQSSTAAVSAPPGVRPEWTFYRDLAAAMGLKLFGGALNNPDELAAAALASGGQVTLDEIRAHPHGLLFGERSIGHLWNYLREVNRPIELCPAEFVVCLRENLAAAAPVTAGRYRIISRRRNAMMNASLTETTGSISADETADSFEINSADAAAAGICTGDQVEIRSDTAIIQACAVVSDKVRRGTLVLAHGWGSPLYDAAAGVEVFRRGHARNKLVSDMDLSPMSGVPRLNGTPVSLAVIAAV